MKVSAYELKIGDLIKLDETYGLSLKKKKTILIIKTTVQQVPFLDEFMNEILITAVSGRNYILNYFEAIDVIERIKID